MRSSTPSTQPILTRLKQLAGAPTGAPGPDVQVLKDAIQEIERLQDALAEARGSRRVLVDLLEDSVAVLRTVDPDEACEGADLEAIMSNSERACTDIRSLEAGLAHAGCGLPILVALREVLSARRRIEREGWAREESGTLAAAAACLCANKKEREGMCPNEWPWRADSWEKWGAMDERSRWVQAAALVLIEWERHADTRVKPRTTSRGAR